MARKINANDGDNNAEIKLVYFEAKNINSDLTGVINAFANAVRIAPVQVISQPPPPAQIENRKAITNGSGQTTMPLDEEGAILAETDTPVASTPATPKRPSQERKPFKGTVLDDMNWDGDGTSLADYINQKKPNSTTKKYLVIAAWFKRHGGHDAVNSNLMYNAYLKMRWRLMDDMSQPLRTGAKPKVRYYIGDGKGNYSITNFGLDAADKASGEESESES